MFQAETRKVVLMIGLGVALLIICIAVVFVIDTHFSLVPWRDDDAEMLWCFLVGNIFFPGAFRHYRAGRKAERKVPWYRHLDLILCLLGLVSGLAFVGSVAQKWVWSIFTSDIGPSHLLIVTEGHLRVLDLVMTILYFSWLVLLILFVYQAIKQKKKDFPEKPE